MKYALNNNKRERVIAPIKIVTETRGGDGTALFLWVYWIITISAIILLNGCMSAAKKAQKVEAKEEFARQAELSQLEKMRKLYPCDTSSSVVDTFVQTRILSGMPIIRNDTVFITDTVETKHTIYKQNTVVDSSLYKSALDSLNSARYHMGNTIASQNKVIADLTHAVSVYRVSSDKWDRLIKWLSIFGGLFVVGVLYYLFMKFKSKLFGL